MAIFNYRAIGANGEAVAGKLNAKDRAEVLSMLREKQWRPISVEQKREAQEVSLAAFTGKVKTKDIAIFCRQFYTMLNSGISIIQCLDILRQQFDNKKLRGIISEVYELVQKGASLSDSMRQYRSIWIKVGRTTRRTPACAARSPGRWSTRSSCSRSPSWS